LVVREDDCTDCDEDSDSENYGYSDAGRGEVVVDLHADVFPLAVCLAENAWCASRFWGDGWGAAYFFAFADLTDTGCDHACDGALERRGCGSSGLTYGCYTGSACC